MMTMTSNAVSKMDAAQPRVPRAALIAFIALSLSLIAIACASFAFYWFDGQQVCALSADACRARLQFTTAQAAAFAEQGIPFLLMVALRYAGVAGGWLAGLFVGLLIVWRRRDDRMALFTALYLFSFGASNGGVTGALVRHAGWLAVPVTLLNDASIPLLILFLMLFPNGRIEPSWARPLAPLWIVVVLVMTILGGTPILDNPVVVGALAVLLIGMFAGLLAAQVVRYRRYSTEREREQVRWALFGIAVMVLLISCGVILVIASPTDNLIADAIIGFIGFNLSLSLLPVFLGVAILRSRLWDIDVIIRRTLVYSVLTALLALVYFGSVVLLQQGFRALTGQGQDLAIILSTLALAALAVPLRNRVQGVIDRRFFRRKYNAAHVLQSFAAAARDEVDLSRLTGNLMGVVEETMQPESVSVWLREGK